MQLAPYFVSSAPPSPPHGECCTSATEASSVATKGVYPIDTESPMISTFFSVVESGSGGPVLQTWSPITGSPAAPAAPITRKPEVRGPAVIEFAGAHVVTTPYPLPWSWQVVPWGQQVYPFEQHTASAPNGQHPQAPFDGIHLHHTEFSEGKIRFGSPTSIAAQSTQGYVACQAVHLSTTLKSSAREKKEPKRKSTDFCWQHVELAPHAVLLYASGRPPQVFQPGGGEPVVTAVIATKTEIMMLKWQPRPVFGV